MSESVGEIEVDLGIDAGQVDKDLKELQEKVERLLKQAGDEGGDAMLHQLTVSIKEAKERLNQLEDTLKPKIEPDVDSKGAQARLWALQRDRKTNIWVTLKGNVASELKRMVKGLSGLSILQKWGQSIRDLIANLPQLALSMAKVTTAVAGLAAPLLSSLTAIAPLAASLTQIIPLALLAAPGITAFAGAIGVLAVAFKGLDKATAPAAKSFNAFLTGVKSDLSELKTTMQQSFFTGGFTDSFKDMIDTLFPAFSAGMKQMSADVSDNLGAAIDGITKAFSGGGLESLFANLSAAAKAAQPGFEGVANALTNIAIKAGPALKTISDEFTILGQRFSDWANSADISGMIQGAIVQTKELFRLVGNLGGVISGLFSSMDTGKSAGLASLADAFGRVRDVIQSPAFQGVMQTIFSGANQGAKALSAALAPLGQMFTNLAPTISKVLSVLGGAAGNALTQIADALSQPVVADGLSSALEGLASIVTNIPFDALGQSIGIIGQAIGSIAPLVVSLLSAIEPLLPPILAAINALIPPITEIVQTVLPPLVDLLMQVLVPALQALSPLVQALMPIFQALSAIIAAITPYLAGLVQILVAGLVPIISVLSQALGGLGLLLSNVLTFAVAQLQVFFNAAMGIFKAISQALSGDFSGAWETIQGVVRTILSNTAATIASIGSKILGTMLSIGSKLMSGFLSAIQGGWRAVSGWLGGIGAKIKGAVGSLGGILYEAGKGVLEGFLRGLQSIWDNIQNFVGSIAGWIRDHKGPLPKDRKLLVPAGKAIMAGFYEAMRAGFVDTQRLVNGFSVSGLGSDFATAVAGAGAGGRVSNVTNNNTQQTLDLSGLTIAGATPQENKLIMDFVGLAKRKARAAGATGTAVMT